jgi:hypothetical protein
VSIKNFIGSPSSFFIFSQLIGRKDSKTYESEPQNIEQGIMNIEVRENIWVPRPVVRFCSSDHTRFGIFIKKSDLVFALSFMAFPKTMFSSDLERSNSPTAKRTTS